MQPRILIAGTDSGVGKTTVTLGLMAAFTKQNKRVQGFKCGPDYIDPTFHEVITKRPSYQLDTWMTSFEWVKDTFVKRSKGADLSIIEGMMGFYDGRSPVSNEGTTYEISQILGTPCLLVININGSARSAAAMVKGYQEFESDARIVGVILNQAGSEGHATLCAEAIQQMCHIPVVGYLKRGDTPPLPERQLGLIPALKQGEYDSLINKLAVTISKQFNLDLIWKLAIDAHPVKFKDDWLNQQRELIKPLVQIAVAYDEAFHFYYDENLRLLKAAGAELTYFSPLKGEGLPEGCDGLYLGGGFPEEYAKELTLNKRLVQQVRKAAHDLMPILAECGGYIYLGESLTLTNDVDYPMAGVIPIHFQMNKNLTSIGYREVTTTENTILGDKGTVLRGHEFHYSSSLGEEATPSFQYKKWNGEEAQQGYLRQSVVASYIHLHFASNPEVAKNWVKACCDYKEKRLMN